MKQKARRHDRLTIVAEGLMAGVLFLLLAPATVQAGTARSSPVRTPLQAEGARYDRERSGAGMLEVTR